MRQEDQDINFHAETAKIAQRAQSGSFSVVSAFFDLESSLRPLTLNNGSDGELLWRFFKTMDDNIASSTDDLIERMMRKVSRNFPYTK